MAFKIQNIDAMRDIPNQMETTIGVAQSERTKLINAIDLVNESVTDPDVDKTLNNFKDLVETSTNDMIKLMTDISAFIKKQTETYASNEENVSAELSDIQSALDGISF